MNVSSGSLEIASLQISDTGLYVCRLDYTSQPSTITAYNLTVLGREQGIY